MWTLSRLPVVAKTLKADATGSSQILSVKSTAYFFLNEEKMLKRLIKTEMKIMGIILKSKFCILHFYFLVCVVCIWVTVSGFGLCLVIFFKSHSDDSDKHTVPEIKSRGQVSSSLQKKWKTSSKVHNKFKLSG